MDAQKKTVDARSAVVFDVDNTLTPPRRPLEPEMAAALQHLSVPFFVCAGSDLRLIAEQFIEPLHRFGYRGSFEAFVCNGTARYHCKLFEKLSTELVERFEMCSHMGEARFQHLMQIIEHALKLPEFQLPSPMRIIGDKIVDRISMINVIPIGRPREPLGNETYANRAFFKEYDERTGFRRRFLKHLRQECSRLSLEEIQIFLGGETSFDVVVQGYDKSYAVRSVLGRGFERLWYLGDALFEGGNDTAILTFIDTWQGTHPCPVKAIQVNNWQDTLKTLHTLKLL